VSEQFHSRQRFEEMEFIARAKRSTIRHLYRSCKERNSLSSSKGFEAYLSICNLALVKNFGILAILKV
jgi:hypothetical protein